MTNGIKRPIKTAATISAALSVPSTRPAKAAAAIAPSASRTRSQAGTSAAFSAPSVEQPSHDIDKLKRHQERVRDRARAEQRRQHGVAGKSEQSRGQRSRRHGEERTDHAGLYNSEKQGDTTSTRAPLLPLPALRGERVGVRGFIGKF